MNSMGCVNRLGKERFECKTCEKAFMDDEVRKTWRCPICNDYIVIYAEDEKTNTKRILIRKRAKEVEVGDLVYLPGGLTGEFYRVLGINSLGLKLGMGLKGYGQYRIDPDDPVNCEV